MGLDLQVRRPNTLWLAGTALVVACTAPAWAQSLDPRRTPVVEVVEHSKNSVVNISAQRIVERSPLALGPGGALLEDYFRHFFGYQPAPRRHASTSLGTGFLIDTAGTVVTNYHVVARAEAIEVTLANGDRLPAELLGAAPDADLALLKLEHDGTTLPPPLEFFSGTPWIGETVVAIGNPYGLDHSVTVGVISATDRTLDTRDRTYVGVLQTDASINPGNSGGPLINLLGQVVGVNTAIYGGDAQGIGFAIPADVVRRVVDELLSSGRLTRGWIGVTLQDLDAAIAAGLNLRSTDGVLVRSVVADSPAARAGLAVGDLIQSVDGHRVRNSSDVEAHLDTYAAGRNVRFAGLRNGSAQAWTITVGAYDRTRINGWFDRIGLKFQDRGDTLVVLGVVPGSTAAELGFEPGDRIVAIDRIPVGERERLQDHLLKHRRKGYFLIGLKREHWGQHVGVRLPPPDPTL